MSYILGNGTFLYFLKRVFFIVWETKLFSLKNKTFQQENFWAQKIKSFLYFAKWNFSAPSLKVSYVSGRTCKFWKSKIYLLREKF